MQFKDTKNIKKKKKNTLRKIEKVCEWKSCSLYLLRVTVSLMRKLQRTFWTSRAWRKPFPLTTTWKDSEVKGLNWPFIWLFLAVGFAMCIFEHAPLQPSISINQYSVYNIFVCIFSCRLFLSTSFTDAGGLYGQDLNAGSLQDLKGKYIFRFSYVMLHLIRNMHLNVILLCHACVFRTESMTPCSASNPSFTGKTWSLLSAIVESCQEIWQNDFICLN